MPIRRGASRSGPASAKKHCSRGSWTRRSGRRGCRGGLEGEKRVSRKNSAPVWQNIGVRRPTRVLDVDPVAGGGGLVPHGAAERHPRGVAGDGVVEHGCGVNCSANRVGSGRAIDASTATGTKDLDRLISAVVNYAGSVLGDKALAVHVRQDPFWRERAKGVKNTLIGTNCARPFPPKKNTLTECSRDGKRPRQGGSGAASSCTRATSRPCAPTTLWREKGGKS